MDADCAAIEETVLDNLKSTYIAKSTVHECGLFAKDDIAQGTNLGYLDGQIIDWDYYNQLCNQLDFEASVKQYFFLEWNALSPSQLLVRPLRTKYSYINHSRNPNLILNSSPLAVVAMRDIKKGEELFLDYRKEPLSEEYLNGHGKTYL